MVYFTEMAELEQAQEEEGMGFLPLIVGAIAGVAGTGMSIAGGILQQKQDAKVQKKLNQAEQIRAQQAAERAPLQIELEMLQRQESSQNLSHYLMLAGMVVGTGVGIYLINRSM